MLEAARRRGQSVDHLLFAGPPGLGKTTLAGIVAAEMGVHLRITSGPALERAGDLAAILTKLDEGDVLFIDEIHRLSRAVEEILYPAMEDFQLDIVVGKGPAASSIRLTLPPFTLVGATTRTGMITGPLRDRFGLVARLDYYDDRRARSRSSPARPASSASTIDEDGAWEIARRSRGTPRIANRLLRRVRDFAEVRADGAVDADIARDGLALFGVDELGLDKVDRAMLTALCQQFGGGPVGLSTLAIGVGEEPDTVEDVYEPFLIQQGMIARTPRGRVAMPAAYRHLGLAAAHARRDQPRACSTAEVARWRRTSACSAGRASTSSSTMPTEHVRRHAVRRAGGAGHRRHGRRARRWRSWRVTAAPPRLLAHRVPYRANVWAMHSIGVRAIVAPCSVGSLQPDIHPGSWWSSINWSTARGGGPTHSTTPGRRCTTRRSPSPTTPGSGGARSRPRRRSRRRRDRRRHDGGDQRPTVLDRAPSRAGSGRWAGTW